MENKARLFKYFLNRCKEVNTSPELFDFEAQIDSSLSYAEGVAFLEEEYFSKFAKEELTREQVKKMKEATKIQEMTESKQDLAKWMIKSFKQSKIYLVLGGRGRGKTALGFEWLRQHYETIRRPCFTYKFPKPHLLPPFIQNIKELNEAPIGAVVFIDEAGIEFNQFSNGNRNSRGISNLIKIARHKDISLIINTQNSGTITKDIRRLVDCFLLKAPSLTQQYEESPMLRKLYFLTEKFFLTEVNKQKGFYIIDTDLISPAIADLPPFWTEEISKAYNGEEEPTNINTICLEYEIVNNKLRRTKYEEK